MPTGTPLSPSTFMARVSNHGGISSGNKFSIMVSPPKDMTGASNAGSTQILCNQVTLPGKALSRTENRIYGIDVQKPYGVTFEPVTLTFYNTNNFRGRTFWENWLNWIQPPRSRNLRYYSEMIGSIQIYHYSDDVPNPTPSFENYCMTLNEAYPMSIEEVELNWDKTEVLEFQVQISYKDWSNKSNQEADEGMSDIYAPPAGSGPS